MPKSGSFMETVLAQLTGHPEKRSRYGCGKSEQDLHLPKLIDHYRHGWVTHQHTRATAANLNLMPWFAIRPVIHVRSLFDMVIQY